MKVALIHDWLNGMRGGEKVLEALCELYPDAPVYTLMHTPGTVSPVIEAHPIITSFLQRAPFVKKHYRYYLPLFPAAIESFDLQSFDLLISSSHCVAKGIIPSASAVHVSYCHTPMRYVWSHFWDYFGEHRIGFIQRRILSLMVNYLRVWDSSCNNRVDTFVANSQCVADRIKRYYGRQSIVVYPPVDIDFYCPGDEQRGDFYLLVSALVPYKRIELAIEAFHRLSLPLVIVGQGPEEHRLRKMARQNVRFLGKIDARELRGLYRTAAALVQPGEEDFGINIVEALSCECPVVAYRRGGVLESVLNEETGLFFNELSAESLADAVDKAAGLRFNKALMRETALRFSPERFKLEFQAIIQEKISV